MNNMQLLQVSMGLSAELRDYADEVAQKIWDEVLSVANSSADQHILKELVVSQFELNLEFSLNQKAQALFFDNMTQSESEEVQ